MSTQPLPMMPTLSPTILTMAWPGRKPWPEALAGTDYDSNALDKRHADSPIN